MSDLGIDEETFSRLAIKQNSCAFIHDQCHAKSSPRIWFDPKVLLNSGIITRHLNFTGYQSWQFKISDVIFCHLHNRKLAVDIHNKL